MICFTMRATWKYWGTFSGCLPLSGFIAFAVEPEIPLQSYQYTNSTGTISSSLISKGFPSSPMDRLGLFMHRPQNTVQCSCQDTWRMQQTAVLSKTSFKFLAVFAFVLFLPHLISASARRTLHRFITLSLFAQGPLWILISPHCVAQLQHRESDAIFLEWLSRTFLHLSFLQFYPTQHRRSVSDLCWFLLRDSSHSVKLQDGRVVHCFYVLIDLISLSHTHTDTHNAGMI